MASLYLHIPFCEKKCLYCDFYSIETTAPMGQFLEALAVEVAQYARQGHGEEFDTVFFGGGTPSLLTPSQLDAILARLRSTFTILPDAEITLETNPGTVTLEKLRAFRSAGINRLSIGIQSFDEKELKFLSRIHDSEQAVQCVRLARRAGFENLSFDLIYSLPGQTADQWLSTLNRGLALEPDHLSAYSLIVEAQTPLARMVQSGEVTPNPGETEAEMFELTMRVMEDHGFEHYEVSNYARPGFRSRHNYSYWSHRNYLGFGPSAHSFWRSADGRSGTRWANAPAIAPYIQNLLAGRSAVAFREEVGVAGLMSERIFLGLRSDGFSVTQMSREFGIEMTTGQRSIIQGLVDEKLAVMEEGTVRLTPRGFLLCDEIAGRLMV